MAKDKLTDYSATNSLNTDVGGVNIDEGMLPSDVNNALREVMTHLKDFAEGTQAVNNIKFAGATTTGDINFGDNDKAVFGAGGDFEIVHTGTNTNLRENGTGNLNVWGDDIYFYNSAGTETKASYLSNGAVTLYYDNSPKLSTTATGCDIVGVLTADGFDIAAGQAITSDGGFYLDCDSDNSGIGTSVNISTNNKANLLATFSDNGDISFYDSAGSSQSFYWDASTQRLGLGTTNPNAKITAQNDSATAYNPSTAAFNTILNLKNTTSGASTNALMSFATESNGEWYIGGVQNTGNTAADFVFASRDSGARAERLRIDSSGNVGIGTASVDNKLHLEHAGTLYLQIENTSTANKFYLGNSGGNAILESTGAYSMNFKTNGSEAARITSGGDIAFGNTSANLVSNTSTQGGGGYVASDKHFEFATNSNRSAVEIGKNNANDGGLVTFRKQGTGVGSIGTSGGDLFIGNGNTCLLFDDGSDLIRSANASGGGRDATTNLGNSSNRFKDLYLSGGVYLGGTGSANYLDDYEEGTWTPAIYYQNADDQTNSSNVSQSGVYTKVGNLVTATCYLKWSATDARANDNIGVNGFPFAPTTSAPDSETRWVAPVRLSGTSYPQGDSQVMAVMYGGGTLATFITANSSSNLGDDFGQNTNMVAYFTITYHAST